MPLLGPSPKSRWIALRIASAFLLAGLIWVSLSDTLVYSVLTSPSAVRHVELAKGWGFVVAAAVFIFFFGDHQIASLQRSEAMTRAILDSIGDAILLLGPDGRVVDFNPAAVELLGVKDTRSLYGMDVRQFSERFHWSYTDGRLVPVNAYMAQRAVRGEPVRPYKGVLFPESGPPRTVHSNVAPVLLDGRHAPTFAVSVMRDITEMEALDRLRDEFFTAAAHSLKTPVTIIQMNTQRLLQRPLADADRDAAQAIDRQCGQITRLVQNLLVLSRLKSGTLRLNPQVVELRPLVEQVIRRMQRASAHHPLHARLEADPKVRADPMRLAQAIENLIDWAFTISPPGTEVLLRLDCVGDHARLGVTYQPWPRAEQGRALFAGLNVSRHVSEQLLSADGATLKASVSPVQTTDWIELPIVAPEHHATA